MLNYGEKTRLALLASLAVTALTSVGTLIFGFVFLAQGSVNSRLAMASSPIYVTVIVTLLLALVIVVSGFGAFAGLKKNRGKLIVFFKSGLAVFVGLLGTFVYILLAGNGALSGGNALLTEPVATLVVEFALAEPADWKAFQDEKIDDSNCCGLDVRSTYQSDVGGYPGLPAFNESDVWSGDKCIGANGLDFLREDFFVNFPVFNDAAEEAADSTVLERVGFLCFDRVTDTLRGFATSGSLAMGSLLFFDAFALAFAASLLYSIKEENGGLKPESMFLNPETAMAAGIGSSKKSFFKRKKKDVPQHGVLHFTQ